MWQINLLATIEMLGETQEFFESFNRTNDSLCDLESVNRDRVNTVYCGYPVSSYVVM